MDLYNIPTAVAVDLKTDEANWAQICTNGLEFEDSWGPSHYSTW